MVKRASLILVVLFLVLIFPIEAAADTTRVVRMAGDENYPPYEFVDKNGYYKGFNVDIMKAIAADQGIVIESVPMTWQDAVKALKNNEVDGIQGIARSTVREKKFVFSEPLLKNAQAIFVRSDTNNITGLESLQGAVVALQSEDINEELIGKVPNIQLIVYSNQEQAIKALLEGEVKAFVGNRYTGLYIIQNMEQYNKVKIVGEPLYTTEYCAATLKGNEELLGLINRGLRNIKNNGEYDKIHKKWFGEPIVDNYADWKRVLLIIASVLAAVCAVIPIIFYWNVSLKKLVAIKISELAEANNELYLQKHMLEHSNRLRGKILESILVGIATFNKCGELLEANKAARQLLNITEEDLTIDRLKLNDSTILYGCEQALQGEIWQQNIEWKTACNRIINIDCRIYPIKDSDDQVEGIIMVLQDYTQSKLLNEAKQYDKLKTEFFANMSHEFRTPLSVILAAAQLLELNGKSENVPALQSSIDKAVKTTKHNINRLTRLVNNIIDVTKADTGFLQLRLRNYNIVNVIEEITMSVVDLIQNKGMSIEFDTDVEERVIACDVEAIERVILNLLSNSVKFTDKGGCIYVNVLDGEEYVTITVRDTGIGIPKEMQNIIFDRFRQVDKSISRVNEGSGIGLSLVKSLIELHGGSIYVESIYGQGSEFIIKLPNKRLDEEADDYENKSYHAGKNILEFSDIYL